MPQRVYSSGEACPHRNITQSASKATSGRAMTARTAIAGGGKVLALDRKDTAVAGVVALTIFATIVMAKLIGCTLPMNVPRPRDSIAGDGVLC